MKRALSVVLIALPLIPLGACSSEESPPELPGVGGTGSSAAGTPSTGGSSAQAGTSTSGGSAGTPSTAGTSSTAGTASTGGSGGTAGSAAGGSAGTGTGGTAGGTGGSGTGGSAGGSGGSGGAPAAVSLGKLDGFLVQTPCKPNTNDDCDSGGWIYEGKSYPVTGGKLDTDAGATKDLLKFPVTGGEPGKVYIATLHFYGVMEPKNYGNSVTREAAPGRPGQANGPSNPAPFAWSNTPGAAVTTTDYNTYEVHVYDDKGAIFKDYYLNADTQQGHWSYVIDYERPIEIVGGGFVKVRSYDNNGRMIKNCGTSNAGPPCAGKGQTVPGISAAQPAITVNQPNLGQPDGEAGQWFAIDVKTIVPK